MQNFSLALGIKDGSPAIHFKNNTDNFIEALFVIDEKEAKEGKRFDKSVRGYGFPPKFEKLFSKTKDGKPLPFRIQGHGTIKAYIYAGEGKFIKENIDLEEPAFMRRKLSRKINFNRQSNEPIEMIELKY